MSKQCACVENVCTRDTRRVLRQFKGRQVQIITLSGRNISGKVLKVTQGVVVLNVNGIHIYIPICRI